MKKKIFSVERSDRERNLCDKVRVKIIGAKQTMSGNVIINESFYTKTDDKKVRTACVKSVREMLIDLVKACQDEVPVDTRNLLRSHHSEVHEEGNKVIGMVKVGENARYWKYIQYGTYKMDANAYITRALSTIEPSKALIDAFKQYFKG